MSEMGLAICCLMCDAPDDAGSSRCKVCIARHEKVRERIARGDDGVARWGGELLAMMSAPERHDHDGVHSQVLRGYVQLLAEHAGPRTPPTQEEIEALFAAARARPKGSLIQDMANQNRWVNQPPDARQARALVDNMDEGQPVHTGKRTIPSREIKGVDRSDRLGEDMGMTDRVAANQAVRDAPEDLKDLLADVHVAQREKKRAKWKKAVDELDDILDD
jgi:hypothetical protein